MIKSLLATHSRRLFLFALLFLVTVDLTTIFNVPIMRQILGFVLLTFIPGGLILLILRLNRLGTVEKIVLSVGLSLAFSMLYGLVVNALLAAIGYDKPLSTASLLISFSIAIIVLAVIVYIRNKDIAFTFSSLKLGTKEKTLLIVPSLFPLLSIVGMRIMNLTDNNILLMFLLFAIPAFVIFISFFRDKLPQRLYPGFIFLISISLLLMLSLRSNHIIGTDVHESYYYFQMTLDNLHWGATTHSLLNAMLSITLLPTIYQLFLNINQEYLYKVLYTLLFSISPLVVYIIAKKYIGNFYAFIAAFLFMSQFVFLWSASGPRTVTAILFFALAIMVLFNDGMTAFTRKLLFIIFAASIILSHYGTSYVFLFILLFTWIGMKIVPWILHGERKTTISKHPGREGASLNSLSTRVMPGSDTEANTTPQPAAFNITQSRHRGSITINMVALFFIMLFFWYSLITVYPFSTGLSLLYRTFANLNQWFLLEAQGSTITAALGEDIHTVPQIVRVVFSWLIVAFIAIGVLSTMARYKNMVAAAFSNNIKPSYLNSKFEMEYFMLSLACSTILVSAFALPFVSAVYSMERVYFQTLVILSPFFILGSVVIARWLRARPHWIMLSVLIPFFMCTSGTMYQIFGSPASIVLNSAGTEYEHLYVHDGESYTATWLEEYAKGGTGIYTDYGLGPRILMSQSAIPRSRLRGSFISPYQQSTDISGYIFLFYPNVVKGEAELPSYAKMDIVPRPDVLVSRNKIYTTGLTEVYR